MAKSLSALFSSLFGPLDKKYCDIYLYMSMFFYAMGVAAVLAAVVYEVTSKSFNLVRLSSRLILTLNMFVAYLMNRLLYSMCKGSL
jgi:hypothetical protein